MDRWIWSVNPDNWEIVKTKKVWAVGTKLRTTRVGKGDIIIFYVKGSGSFKGIFKVVSGWYDATESIWNDEKGEILYDFHQKKSLRI